MELVLQNETLSSFLKLSKHRQTLVRRQTGGEYGCTELCRDEAVLINSIYKEVQLHVHDTPHNAENWLNDHAMTVRFLFIYMCTGGQALPLPPTLLRPSPIIFASFALIVRGLI